MLTVLLMGCSAPISAEAPQMPSEQSPSQVSPVQMSLGQTLPISAKAIINNQVIQLEVARTPEQQAMGLMYRTSLPAEQGMLFSFGSPRPVSFWMKNTLIPLDMLFLRNGKIQGIEVNVPPCKKDPCPTYGPDKLVDQVIELRGGRAAELGLKVGDQVVIQEVDPKKN